MTPAKNKIKNVMSIKEEERMCVKEERRYVNLIQTTLVEQQQRAYAAIVVHSTYVKNGGKLYCHGHSMIGVTKERKISVTHNEPILTKGEGERFSEESMSINS